MANSRRRQTMGMWLGFVLGVLASGGPGTAQEISENAALRDFNAAAALQNAGLYDRAVDKWTAFIAQYPGNARLDRAHYYLGICQLHARKYATAISTFQTLLSKYPSFANAEGAQYNLGMARYRTALESKKREDYTAAAAALGEMAARFPQGKNTAFALYYQGESFLGAGDPRQALDAYKKVLGKSPGNTLAADTFYALGTTQQEQGQDSDAIATFQKFLSHPGLAHHELVPEVRLRLGLSFFKQKRYADAEPHLGLVAAVKGFANADLALLRQGQCRLQLGKTAEGTALLADLPRLFPSSRYRSEARLAAGKQYFLTGKLSEALQVLEPLARARERESTEAAYWLARAMLKTNRSQEALALLENVLQTRPEGGAAVYLELARADALNELPGRRKEAATAYEKFAAQHPDHPLSGQALSLAASASFDDRDFAAARRQADSFLDNPRLANHELTPSVLCLAAESYLAAGGDAARAERYYRQLISRFSTSSYAGQALYKLAELCVRKKHYDEALTLFEKCRQQFPQGEYAVRAQYGLAAASFGRGDTGSAAAALEKVFAANPDAALAARARFLRGLVLQRQQQLDGAVKDLETFLNGNPSADEAVEARYVLVLCRIALKQFPEASAALAVLVQQRPNHPQAARAYYDLGHALVQENRGEEAARAFRTLAEKFPASPLAAEGWFHVGQRYEETAERASTEEQKMAETGKAAEAYTMGLARAREAELREKLQYKLAEVQSRRKQYDQAVATLQAQLRDFPAGSLTGPGRYLLAECLFRQNKFDEALPLFTRLIDDKVAKYGALALYRAGTCTGHQKKWPDSQKFYETLLHDYPHFEQVQEARYGLAVALQNQGKRDAARTLQEQVAREAEGETAAKARFMLGEIAFAERKFEDAIEQYLRVTSGYPYKQWQGLAQFEIGRCFVSLGRRQKALEAFQTVVDKYPDHSRAQDAARMLAELK